MCGRERGFQSSPGPWAECNVRRVLRDDGTVWLFQSSPGPWAECNVYGHRFGVGASGFQSSPGPWAECNMGSSSPVGLRC